MGQTATTLKSYLISEPQNGIENAVSANNSPTVDNSPGDASMHANIDFSQYRSASVCTPRPPIHRQHLSQKLLLEDLLLKRSRDDCIEDQCGQDGGSYLTKRQKIECSSLNSPDTSLAPLPIQVNKKGQPHGRKVAMNNGKDDISILPMMKRHHLCFESERIQQNGRQETPQSECMYNEEILAENNAAVVEKMTDEAPYEGQFDNIDIEDKTLCSVRFDIEDSNGEVPYEGQLTEIISDKDTPIEEKVDMINEEMIDQRESVTLVSSKRARKLAKRREIKSKHVQSSAAVGKDVAKETRNNRKTGTSQAKVTITLKKSAVLNDPKTIEYVKNSKVVLIAGGQDGQNYSAACQQIKNVYGDNGENAVGFSIFFCSSQVRPVGIFISNLAIHRKEKMVDAGVTCLEQLEKAARDQASVIVLNFSEFSKRTLPIIREYGYVIVVLKDDSDIGINQNLKKIWPDTSSTTPMPLYYGWFLNDTDSDGIFRCAMRFLQQALDIPNFFSDLTVRHNLKTVGDVVVHYGLASTKRVHNLHCTAAMFVDAGNASGGSEYMANPLVAANVGVMHSMDVVGFLLTPRSFGARLKLSDVQLELWGQNDSQTDSGSLPNFTPDQHWGDEYPVVCEMYPTCQDFGSPLTEDNGTGVKIVGSDVCVFDDTPNDDDSRHDNTIKPTFEAEESDLLLSGKQPTNGATGVCTSVFKTKVENSPENIDISRFVSGMSEEMAIPEFTMMFEDDCQKHDESDIQVYDKDEEQGSTGIFVNEQSLSAKSLGDDQEGILVDNSFIIETPQLSFNSICKSTLTVSPSKFTNMFPPTHGKGSRAHFTLGCVSGVKPVTVGFDLVNIIRKEENKQCFYQQYKMPGAVLKSYGDGVWVFYPEDQVTVQSLFSVHYN